MKLTEEQQRQTLQIARDILATTVASVKQSGACGKMVGIAALELATFSAMLTVDGATDVSDQVKRFVREYER